MKYTPEKIAEAARFGWTINPETGTWSSNCTVCGEYKVIPSTGSGACRDCIRLHRSE
jgi:hypothetical protein